MYYPLPEDKFVIVCTTYNSVTTITTTNTITAVEFDSILIQL